MYPSVMSDYSDPPTNTPNQYSEDDNPARTTSIGATKPVDGHARAPSTSSLSAAQDPDQDAEGETDDLDGDADGIKDDDVMDYSYEQQDVNGAWRQYMSERHQSLNPPLVVLVQQMIRRHPSNVDGTDEEDDKLAEDSSGFSEGDNNQAQALNGLYGTSTGDNTMPTAGQLTVCQGAKEYGEPVTELQSLLMSEPDLTKKKELTEADWAMEKAEKSRTRKHLNHKKV
ncbi:hypothetical protein PSTT_06186 [Puccinia striiformis]|uniref:Uncharacterized protein n=1 Tax=Puccinia striiformis TaxID=27350 RepID=A0A2S4VLE3_9BASI|nr:hypothetical protein PSTT_06186 [Puccinia striiformis]